MKKYFQCSILFILPFLTSISNKSYAGNQNDTIIFAYPIEEPIELSANFGELRVNHFHGGLDFRTGGTEGKPVFAVAEGYISRIRIDSKGYGNQLFITHPNGYISSYSHLQHFNDRITKYIQDIQSKREQNLIDITVPQADLPVKCCEMIALSGNTGSSRGPHLHFELIEQATGKEINPLKFYTNIKDDKNPQILNIKLYPLDDESYVNNSNAEKICQAVRKPPAHDYSLASPISVYGNIGFAIQGYDHMSSFAHIFGYYSIQLSMDNTLVYEQAMDEISPTNQRTINSYIDYAHFIRTKNYFQKTFVDPNNKLTFYKKLNNNRGVINFTDSGIHTMSFVVKDYKGNSSRLNFTVSVKQGTAKNHVQHEGFFFPCSQRNTYKTDNFKVIFGAGSMYDDFYFKFKIDSVTPVKHALSPIISLQDASTPINDSVILSIKVKTSVPEKYKSKLLIAEHIGKNGTIPTGGRFDSGFVSVSIHSFGKYVVIIDTAPPGVQPLKIYDRQILTSKSAMFFKVWDGLSGIGKFNMWIDNSWVIMYYDQKSGLLSHWFDPSKMEYGKWHKCKLIVEDTRRNAKVTEFTFFK